MSNNKENNYSKTSMDKAKEERQRLNRLNNMEKVAELNRYDTETGSYDKMEASDNLEACHNMEASDNMDMTDKMDATNYNKSNATNRYDSETGSYDKKKK